MTKMKLYVIWPICLPVAYLLAAIVNYYIGFAVFPEVSVFVSILFFACALALMLGYSIGLRFPSYGPASIVPTGHGIRLILFWGSLAVIIGYSLQIVNSLILGINITSVLEETNQIRDMAQATILTKLSVLFQFMIYPTLGSMAYMLSCRIKIRWYNWLLLVVIGFLVVFNSFLSVNRNPILGFGISLVFVYLIGMRVSFDRKLLSRIFRASLMIFAFFLLFGFYSRFIVDNREKASLSKLETKAVGNSRYDFDTRILSNSDVRFLHTASYYFSHQFPYVDQAIKIKGPVRFNPTVMNTWLTGQLSGLFPGLYYLYVSGPLAVNFESGIPYYTWNSIVGMLVAGFGWLPPPFIFLLIGYFMGKNMASFARRPSYLSLMWLLLFYQCMSKPYMGFDFNMHANGLFFFIVAVIFLHQIGLLKRFRLVH